MNREYCSRKCFGKAHIKTVVRVCPICVKEFVVVGTHDHPARYCSDECRREAHWRQFPRMLPSQLGIPDEFWKLPYLAGLVDGEGSIKVDRSGCKNNIQVVNTDLRLISWIEKNFGGKVIVEKRATKRRKTLYRWSMSRQQDVLVLLKLISPYLIIKRDKAENMIVDIYNRLRKHFPEFVELGLLPSEGQSQTLSRDEIVRWWYHV